jgi:hypothetical protein
MSWDQFFAAARHATNSLLYYGAEAYIHDVQSNMDSTSFGSCSTLVSRVLELSAPHK